MNADSWQALALTLKLATVTSIILLLIAVPLAWWLSRWRHPLKALVQALIALPLILPPTVLGFYLLLVFSPQSPPGQFLSSLFDTQLAFSFTGILVASIIYSLPFAVQPVYQAFSSVEQTYLDTAKTLGLSPWQCFSMVVAPLSKSGFFTAFILVFAHTIGEFGVILMIGGNIPGETRVLSVALFDQVESLQFDQAHQISLLLVVFSLLVLSALFYFNRRQKS